MGQVRRGFHVVAVVAHRRSLRRSSSYLRDPAGVVVAHDDLDSARIPVLAGCPRARPRSPTPVRPTPRRWPAPACGHCPVRRTRRRAAAPDRRPRHATTRRPPAAMPTPSTTIRHGWQSLSRPGRRGATPDRRDADRPGRRLVRVRRRGGVPARPAVPPRTAPRCPFRAVAPPLLDDLHSAAVADRCRPRRRRQQLVGLLHLRRQLAHQVDPRRDELRSVRGEVTVPHVEGVEHAAVTAIARGRRGLQQRRPLAEHLVVVRADRRHLRAPSRRELIEVPAPFAGVAAHQREILRCEQHRAQRHPESRGRRARGSGSAVPCWPARR